MTASDRDTQRREKAKAATKRYRAKKYRLRKELGGSVRKWVADVAAFVEKRESGEGLE